MSRSARLIWFSPVPSVAWSRNFTEMSWRTPILTRELSTISALAEPGTHAPLRLKWVVNPLNDSSRKTSCPLASRRFATRKRSDRLDTSVSGAYPASATSSAAWLVAPTRSDSLAWPSTTSIACPAPTAAGNSAGETHEAGLSRPNSTASSSFLPIAWPPSSATSVSTATVASSMTFS
ncbi:putative histidine kinase [Mycobacterium phage Henu3]|uniref:Putative histidine kinase n=1 Tax=Mycobacterium phage Henu3 TaxID=2492961 RepID=A0A410T7P8_9CAUD|nr:putative histidine kinase [Mycobacterium phage Henu3]QAU05021.1 putative histidine kinase [Mycobacterium phage Henu3]